MLTERIEPTFEWANQTEEQIHEWEPTGNVHSDWLLSKIVSLVWILTLSIVGVGIVILSTVGPMLLAGSQFGSAGVHAVMYIEFGIIGIWGLNQVKENFREYRDQHSAA